MKSEIYINLPQISKNKLQHRLNSLLPKLGSMINKVKNYLIKIYIHNVYSPFKSRYLVNDEYKDCW